MGSQLGALKVAAKRVNVSLEEYIQRQSAGQRWCTGHKNWHDVAAFGSDATQRDGIARSCFEWRRANHAKQYTPRQNRRYGPLPYAPRDGDKKQARQRINVEVRTGKRTHPNALACVDCGHIGSDKRHEYDHFPGYAAKHHYDVEPVCTTCHHRREVSRHE